MTFIKTSAAVLALIVTVSAVSPALAAPQYTLSQLDAELDAATQLVKRIQNEGMTTADGLKRPVAVLLWLARQRDLIAQGEVRLAQWLAAYRLGVQNYNAMVREFEEKRQALTQEEIAAAKAVLLITRATLEAAGHEIEQGMELRAKAYADVLPRVRSLVQNLKTFVAQHSRAARA